MAFAVLLAVVIVVPIAGWVWLTSESGGRWIRDFAVSAANGQLQGTLEIDRVRLLGLLRFELEGARLYAPVFQNETASPPSPTTAADASPDAQPSQDSGAVSTASVDQVPEPSTGIHPAVSLDRIIVDVRFAALLARRAELAELTIEGPRAHIVPQGESTNLARALESRQVASEEPRAESSSSGRLPDFTVHAPNISIRNASFRSEGESPVDVGPVDLTVSASGKLDDLAVAIGLNVQATEPMERTVSMESSLRYFGDSVDLESLEVASGGIVLNLSAHARTDGSRVRLRSLELLAPAADVNELAPAANLLGDVRLVGKGELEDGAGTLAANISLPAGSVHVEATARLPELSRPLGYGAVIRLDAIEPQRIIDGLPAARVTATLEIDGEGLPPENTGRVRLDASGTRYENLELDRMELVAALRGLEATIENLLVRTAGVTVNASGVAGAERGKVGFEVKASDLASTRRAIARGLGMELPELAGSVLVSGSVAGAWSEPAIEATVTSPHLVAAGTRLEGARISVETSQLTPLPRGGVEVDAAVLDLGERVGRDLSVRASIDGNHVNADVAGTFDGLPIGFSLDGKKLDSPLSIEKWELSSLSARAFGIQFESRQATRVEAANGRYRVDGLVLEGNLGTVSLDARGGSTGPVDAKLLVSNLRLDSIPPELVPGGLPLSGVLGLDAQVSGTAASPNIDAKLRFDDGSFRELQPFALALDARVADDRASAIGQISLPNDGEIRLAASASLSAMTNRSAPLSTSLTVENVDLAILRAVSPDVEPVDGRVSGAFTVSGSLGNPRLNGRLQVHDLAARGVDEVLVVASTRYASRSFELGVDVSRPGAVDLALRASAPVDVPALIDDPSALDPRSIDTSLHLALKDLNLGWLSEKGFAPEGYAGRVVGNFSLNGSMAAPKTDARFAVSDLAASGYSDIHADLVLVAGDFVELTLDARWSREPLAQLSARLDAPPGRLAELETSELYDLPLALMARLHPTSLATLMNDTPDAASTNGVAQAVLEVAGTANQPRFSLNASVDDIVTEGLSVGRLLVESSYQQESLSFDARFESSRSGSVLTSLRMPGALGASVLLDEGTGALLSRHADLRIESDSLDLSVLNGLVPSVRELAGVLDVALLKTGPLGGYDVSGTIALRDGRMSPGEFGTFHGLTIDTDIAFPKITVSTLSGRAGKGSFDVRLDAEASEDLERVVAALEIDVDQMPLVKNFQRRADLTMKLRANATYEDNVLSIPEMRIQGGRVVIPEKLVKSVQDLDPHPDIVFDDELREETEVDGSGMLVRASVVIPDDFIVEAPLGTVLTFGSRLDVTRDPSLLLQGADSALDVVGNVRVVRGTINLLGRRFEVDEGRVQFLPRNFSDPSLAIKARFDGPDAEVLVDISGNASDPKTNFTSNPSMDEAEIFFYLMTGKRQTRAQSGTVEPGAGDYLADAGLAALGSTAASIMKGALSQVLPKELEPDVLSVESSGGQVRTRAGKFITERLYIGTQIHPAADVNKFENTVEMEGEYRMTDDTYLRGRGGDSGKFNAEFIFQKEIPTREQRGARSR